MKIETKIWQEAIKAKQEDSGELKQYVGEVGRDILKIAKSLRYYKRKKSSKKK